MRPTPNKKKHPDKSKKKDKDMHRQERVPNRPEEPDLEQKKGRYEDPQRDQDQSVRRFEKDPQGGDPNVR